MLTDQQVRHFRTFGFVALPGLFPSDEMSEIEREFEEVMEEERQGQAFHGEKRQAVMAFAELRPKLMSLIDDDRIYGPMEQLLGPEFLWWGSDGNLYVGDTSWHPDAPDPEMGHGRIKIAFYLDPVTRDSGCIRFIPGSHRMPFHDQLRPLRMWRTLQTIAEGRQTEEALKPYIEQGLDPNKPVFGVEQPDLPGHAVESNPGDVVFFEQHLYHGSWGRPYRPAHVHAELLRQPHDPGAARRAERHAQAVHGSAAGPPVQETRTGPRGRFPEERPSAHQAHGRQATGVGHRLTSLHGPATGRRLRLDASRSTAPSHRTPPLLRWGAFAGRDHAPPYRRPIAHSHDQATAIAIAPLGGTIVSASRRVGADSADAELTYTDVSARRRPSGLRRAFERRWCRAGSLRGVGNSPIRPCDRRGGVRDAPHNEAEGRGRAGAVPAGRGLRLGEHTDHGRPRDERPPPEHEVGSRAE